MKFTGIFIVLILVYQTGWTYSRFGERFCNQPEYTCISIKRGDSWGLLFPDPVQRDIVRRVNRMNVFLEPDMIIAVPGNLSKLTANDLSPFSHSIAPDGRKKIYVDLNQLAWGAYDGRGKLIKWGPLSSGTKICLDSPEGCLTPTGTFRVIRKGGADCVSKKFPQRMNGVNGGGEMPFCMFFYRGYALHGSSDLPGYQASYGCLRLFIEDAQWLNDKFVELPAGGNNGTRVIIHADSG